MTAYRLNPPYINVYIQNHVTYMYVTRIIMTRQLKSIREYMLRGSSSTIIEATGRY